MTKTKRMRPLLGTFVEIGVLSNDPKVSESITEAFNIIEKIQSLLSFHDPNSDLSQLNKSGHQGVELHPLSADVLRLALHMTGLSGGDFNCTVGGALVTKGALPNHGTSHYLASGSVDDVILEGYHARLVRPVQITLDGIAKGYAVDQAVNLLKQRGIDSGWINAGGDMRLFGEVEQPIYRREIDQSLSFLGDFSNASIATSSASNHYDNRFPSMILNSHTNTYKTGIWTVKAGLSWLADALTKVAGVSQDEDVSSKISSLGGELILGSPS